MENIRALLKQGDVEASAPCRIDMGGTLDLSTFFLPLRHLEPCTFNIALNLRTRVRLSPYEPGMLKINSRGFESLEVEFHHAPFSHPMGLICAIAAYFKADGVQIHIESASPPRSALGGSSVAGVALIMAFFKALGRQGFSMPDPTHIALLAHAIEQSVAGVPCGLQDQLAAAFGGVNGWFWGGGLAQLDFDRHSLIPPEKCDSFSQNLLIAYCGAPHVSADINGTWVRDFLAGRHREQWEQIVACCQAFISAIRQEDVETAQEWMNRETDLRLDMTPDVLDHIGGQLVAKARQYQCGARFTGAGGGGCVWALGTARRITRLRPHWEKIVSQHPEAKILDASVDPNGVL